MPTVTYIKPVSDNKLRFVIQRIADLANRDIRVHSGDRNYNPRGGSKTSLHMAKRAADLHIKGMSDAAGFAFIKQNYEKLLDFAEAYEIVHHGKYTETEGEHIHIGRYGDGRGGYAVFKTEGITPGTGGTYVPQKIVFSDPKGMPINPMASNTAFNAGQNGSPANISATVGTAGVNDPIDVRLIQIILNLAKQRLSEARIIHEPFANLVENGICGEDTIKAINIFQRDVMGWKNHDGRIDPGGNTIQTLYIAAYNSPEVIVRELNKNKSLSPENLVNGEAPGTYEWNGNLAWGSHPNVSSAFREKVMRICGELGIKNPSWLMSVMAFETMGTFRADIPNQSGSSGIGLIQFMKYTIDGRTDKNGKFRPGLGARIGIRHSQLAGMTNVQQLDVVKAYFEDFGSRPRNAKNVADLYFLVLYPKAFGKNNDDPLFYKGTDEYRTNNFDDPKKGGNNDGIVQVGEVSAKIRNMHQEGLLRRGYRMQ